MPQLLLELFSEEIPARMQANAARDLERLLAERLKDAGLAYDSIVSFAGPRRLTLVVEGLPATKHTAGTNYLDVAVRVVRGRVVVLACEDNLVRGASGVAVQNFNRMFGFDERTALD